MFTGIIEDLGEIKNIEREGSNIHYTLTCSFVNELKIDQSLAHNGVCLTVVNLDAENYTVTAIDETLNKTSLSDWGIGDKVNLERCMSANGRFDGHIVQGHVDTTGKCISIIEKDGSWVFTFQYTTENMTVEKGSITVNGASLTVVDSKDDQFSVHIIPYTYEHTQFHALKVGSTVNLEFDILGKYIAKMMRRN
ncbi:riboflavin synthase [Brumimicrobium mesophilum]|uniref:riboflavin synthase n=1 Tax=Brumimicrobium mesophilum TaxID=392717 RepID=UPI000D1444B2|nr:riboflavin synthase [Brumimicrobium mesophilum]